ncbi:MAG: Flp pilus assembly protein CpaB [Thermodesulfobacteriota bacterium]|jgi:pilus assembly protein CpaB|nr:MAG: Flp pilus assembly protein CpaB [Thermodesulfobacteriota bacterium]
MERWKAFLPILIAVIIALIGAFAANKWLKKQAIVKGKPTIGETAQIAVAKVDLPWGTKLTSEALTSARFIKNSLPTGYFTDLAALNNRVLLSPVSRNEPILESRLAPVSIATGGVSAVIPSGKRAIAVKGDKVIGLSGLIQPGNRVDVLFSITNPETQTEITKIVLQDILVLAANTQIEKGKKEGEAAPVDVYTLEVTPEDGEKLALAATQGRLQFALRNPMDLEMVVTRGATIPDTLGMLYIPGNKKSPEPMATRGPSAVHESEVTIINGSKATVVKHAL